jgi:RNA polymerase sigma-70 factor (ECF subfamily)
LEEDLIIQLLTQVKKGELQYFSQIIIAYQKSLFHYILCIVNNTQDAEDILQETFVIAIKKIHQYKFNTHFSAWLYRIARNLSFDTLKKRKKIVLFERSELDHMLESNSIEVDHYDNNTEKINAVFNKMTLKEKNILVLRIFEEKTYEEIAYITKTGQSASRKQYERARKKFIRLYNQINQEEFEYGDRKHLEGVF